MTPKSAIAASAVVALALLVAGPAATASADPATYTLTFGPAVPGQGTVTAYDQETAQTLTSPAAVPVGDDIILTATGSAGYAPTAPTIVGSCDPHSPGSDNMVITVTADGCSVAWNFAATPIANPVTTTASADSTTHIAADITGSATRVDIATWPGEGSVSVNGLGFDYTPYSGYTGPDSFTYTATGPGGTSTSATVDITVAPGPHQVTLGVDSGDGTISMTELTPVAQPLASGDSVPDGATVRIDTVPTAGWERTYVSGVYQQVAITPTSLTILVTGDSWVYTAFDLLLPTATSTTSVVQKGQPRDITLPYTGADATVALDDLPDHGSVTLVGDVATYTPHAGYTGADSFTFTATNATGTSNEATVTLAVVDPAVTLSTETAPAGGSVVVSGTGFAPGETLTVVLHSDPVTLGTATAGPTGTFSLPVTIPTSTTAGSHTISVTGSVTGTTSSPISITRAATVLASTGTDGDAMNGALDAALLLAAVGAGLVVARRVHAARR